GRKQEDAQPPYHATAESSDQQLAVNPWLQCPTISSANAERARSSALLAGEPRCVSHALVRRVLVTQLKVTVVALERLIVVPKLVHSVFRFCAVANPQLTQTKCPSSLLSNTKLRFPSSHNGHCPPGLWLDSARSRQAHSSPQKRQRAWSPLNTRVS